MPTLTAKITKVEHDIATGWYRISTDGELKRLETKIREKAEEAAKLMRDGVEADIEYTENPRTVDGRTYRNAYYDRAAAAGPSPQSSGSGIEQVAPAPQRRRDPDESWRIMLQTGAKLAVATIPHLPPEQRGFDAQQRIAVAWATFFSSAPKPGQAGTASAGMTEGFQPFAQAQAAQEARQGGYENPADGGYVHSDDDIPF